jgi:integration host factor subunit beta
MAARSPHLYQRDVEHIVDAILGGIVDALERGERVELRGFGAFSIRPRQAHRAKPAHWEQGATEKLAPSSRRGRKCASD